MVWVSSFGFIEGTFSFVLDLITLWYGILPLIWDWSLDLIQMAGFTEENEVGHVHFLEFYFCSYLILFIRLFVLWFIVLFPFMLEL